MKRGRQWMLWGGIGGIVLLLFLLFFFGLREKEQEKEKYSAVLYQYSEEGWTSFIEGVRQAEKDFGVCVNIVTTAKDKEDKKAEEQLALIEREITNGAQGILAAAADSDGLSEAFAKISETVPLVTAETGVGSRIPLVAADDYAMGEALAEQILKDFAGREGFQIAVIDEFTERDSVRRRYLGLCDRLKKASEQPRITTWRRGDGDYYLDVFVKSMEERYPVDAIAALDKYATEQMIGGHERYQNEVRGGKPHAFLHYGIGNTGGIVSSLDKGKLAALAYQNEFNMGYQSLELLIAQKRKKRREPPQVTNGVVTRETLYEPENQRLLFPLV